MELNYTEFSYLTALTYEQVLQSKGVSLVSALVGTLHLYWISEFPECISK